ncbi:ABC transporter ATP-binding protein [Agrococcus jejuensis]|uniref:Spermidine/putrescine import ATP-binding protein PotA n=1 Tax=Agrococcus jejuensis TaxID=399736 RepID=A0A1G8BV76_9MICO|nr:ABC transporter ATP-binding protein [Agrococcus jejuensis]SDH37107.1 spermidine/putrescine transport system ATP-binding protein [Agrococcus jejuensis]
MTDTAAQAALHAAAEAQAGDVTLTGVTKRYGDAVAVDGLDLHIAQGEFLSLLGPSGCGKTTTLRMIAGFEEPDAGDIRISGASVVGVPPHRRHVNTVFQQYALFPHLTVAENVAFGLRRTRVPRSEIGDRVVEALDMVRMRSFADRRPTALSGGQQQRIALARALVNRPSVLLLDEPLSALDRQLREEMQVELKLLQARLGTTFVFVTHDQGEALSMSDRIAVMRAGRIEQLADADTVYGSPASAYVAGFIGRQNFFAGTASGALVEADGVTLRGTADLVAGTQVRAAIRPEAVTLAAGEDAGENRIIGRLVGISHLGESMQFIVESGRHSIVVLTPRPTAPRVEPGEAVTLSWSPADVAVFPDETVAAPAEEPSA